MDRIHKYFTSIFEKWLAPISLVQALVSLVEIFVSLVEQFFFLSFQNFDLWCHCTFNSIHEKKTMSSWYATIEKL